MWRAERHRFEPQPGRHFLSEPFTVLSLVTSINPLRISPILKHPHTCSRLSQELTCSDFHVGFVTGISYRLLLIDAVNVF